LLAVSEHPLLNLSANTPPPTKNFKQKYSISWRNVLTSKGVDEVVMGSITKAGTDWNLAREAVLGSSLDNNTPAFDLQRACGTGLSGLVMIANKIALGQIECGIAGGSDTNSKVALEFSRQASDKFIGLSRSRSTGEMISGLTQLRPSDFKPKVPGITEPRTGLSMGEHCELMAQEWKIKRRSRVGPEIPPKWSHGL
jgi:acetyl-CoA C-acetyltransferase